MVKVAVLSDIHLKGGVDTQEAKALQKAAEIIAKEECNIVLFGGDIFDAKATPEQEMVLGGFIKKMRSHPERKIVLLRGNHDESKQLSALESFNLTAVSDQGLGGFIMSPMVEAVETPRCIESHGVNIHCIPHFNAGALAATAENSSEYAEAGTDAFTQILNEIRQDVMGNNAHSLVLFHGVVSGARLDNDMIPRANGIHLPIEELATIGCPVVGGHYHKNQNVAEAHGFVGKHVWYTGSITRQNYGESNGDKGFMIFETGEGNQWLEPRFISLDPPQMITVNAEFKNGIFTVETNPLCKFTEGSLKNTMVRFRYTYAQEERGLVNLDLVKSIYSEALDLKIEGIPEVAVAVRCEAVAKAKNPLDAFREWGQSRGDSQERIEAAILLAKELDSLTGHKTVIPAPLEEATPSQSSDAVSLDVQEELSLAY